MKFLITLAMIIFSTSSLAREEYQVGVILGAPTGVSGKMYLNNNRSIDAAMAWSLADDLGIEFHADYLIENSYAFSLNAPHPLELYYGIGGRIAAIDKGEHKDEVAIGPRTPVGVTYTIANPNLQFFGELALILNVVPDTNVDFDAGIGARYRF